MDCPICGKPTGEHKTSEMMDCVKQIRTNAKFDNIVKAESERDQFQKMFDNTCSSGECGKGLLEHSLGEYASHGNVMSQARARRVFKGQ
jgi:hypothetical protein